MKLHTRALLDRGQPLLWAALVTVSIASHAHAGLITDQVFTGTLGLSTSGAAFLTPSGTVSANVPAGATVLGAYLYTSLSLVSPAGNNFNSVGGSLNGVALSNSAPLLNPTLFAGSPFLATLRADVTSIVKPIIDAGAGGNYGFTLTENRSDVQDGSALVVVYSLASLTQSTVAILWGTLDAADGPGPRSRILHPGPGLLRSRGHDRSTEPATPPHLPGILTRGPGASRCRVIPPG